MPRRMIENRNDTPPIQEGVIVKIYANGTIDVQINNNPTPIKATLARSASGCQVGDRCLMQWYPVSKKWVVSSSYGTGKSSELSSTSPLVISSGTLGEDDADIEIMNIPQTYNTLTLFARVRTTANSTNATTLVPRPLYLTVNGVVTANYGHLVQTVNNGAVSYTTQVSQTQWLLGSLVTTADAASAWMYGIVRVDFPGYSDGSRRAIQWQGTAFSANNVANIWNVVGSGVSAAFSSPIALLRLWPGSGNFIAGCSWTLVGV